MTRLACIFYKQDPLRVDLTPSDLYTAGYFIRAHVTPGKWCWWRKNPFDPKGIGEIFSAPFDSPSEAVAEARRLIEARQGACRQPLLLAIEET